MVLISLMKFFFLENILLLYIEFSYGCITIFFFFFCDVGSRVVFWNATCQFGSVWQSHGRGALEDSRDESFEELCVRTGRGSFTSRDWRRRKFKVISLEWWRANARNVSFGTLYGGQFTFSTQLIILNYPDILSHRRSTTISLETYPLYSYFLTQL